MEMSARDISQAESVLRLTTRALKLGGGIPPTQKTFQAHTDAAAGRAGFFGSPFSPGGLCNKRYLSATDAMSPWLRITFLSLLYRSAVKENLNVLGKP